MDATARTAPAMTRLHSRVLLLAILGQLAGLVAVDGAQAQEQQANVRVFPTGTAPPDARLKPLRAIYDKYHPWTPPTTREAWEQEATRIRQQLLVANGLWPLPEKTELHPVVHGKLDRGDYTVEKVYFASRPGLYVTGSLFKPKKIEGKIPAVLCPHGHWENGRFYNAGDKGAAEQMQIGAEEFLSGAHYPLQARMVQLARMGCMVFHYDMIGYADSQPLDHREGFNDAQASLWLENKMGLQTWNSIRALDFVLSLPEVDPARIGVTGASGGGTQTFMLGALDSRVTAAFPAVMVSTDMQGGCVCENADYLRIGINNIAIAALFAPRPMAMSGADDWTIDIETKGLPELKQIYSLYEKAANVDAKCFPQFKHNYNQPAREYMYGFMNAHLGLEEPAPVAQSDFWPLTKEQLSVFDAEHPVPDDALPADKLRDLMTQETKTWYDQLRAQSASDQTQLRETIGAAVRVMFGESLTDKTEVTANEMEKVVLGDYVVYKGTCSRAGKEQAIPFVVGLHEQKFSGHAVIWLDGKGKSALVQADGHGIPEVIELLDAGYAVVTADLFLTGEYVDGIAEPLQYKLADNYSGITLGYNWPLISQRVQDIVTLVATARKQDSVNEIHLVGTGEAGLWVALARALMPKEAVSTTRADLRGFTFAGITSTQDPNLLPGALKYGGLGGLIGLAAPAQLTLYGVSEETKKELSAMDTFYRPVSGKLEITADPLTPQEIADTLLD